MRSHQVFLPAVLSGMLIVSAFAQTPKPAVTKSPSPAITFPPRPVGASGARKTIPKNIPPKEMTDEEKTIYALGLSVSRSLRPFALSATELDLIKRALTDADAGKPAVDLEALGPRIQALAQERAALVVKREKEASAAWLASAAKEPGAIQTASGLVYKELTPGTGASPTASDTVKVHYRGTLIDGTEFDSSY